MLTSRRREPRQRPVRERRLIARRDPPVLAGYQAIAKSVVIGHGLKWRTVDVNAQRMVGCLVPHIMNMARTERQSDTGAHLPASERHLALVAAPRNGLDKRTPDDMERTP